MNRSYVLSLLLTLAAPAVARVGVINLGPSYYEVTSEVQTPHIRWAKPLAGGPLRVLIVAPRQTQRETVELRLRLQMDYVAVGTEQTGVLGGPVAGSQPLPPRR